MQDSLDESQTAPLPLVPALGDATPPASPLGGSASPNRGATAPLNSSASPRNRGRFIPESKSPPASKADTTANTAASKPDRPSSADTAATATAATLEEPAALSKKEDAPAPSEPDAPALSEPDAPALSEPDVPAPTAPDAPTHSESDAPTHSEPDAPTHSEPDPQLQEARRHMWSGQTVMPNAPQGPPASYTNSGGATSPKETQDAEVAHEEARAAALEMMGGASSAGAAVAPAAVPAKRPYDEEPAESDATRAKVRSSM